MKSKLKIIKENLNEFKVFKKLKKYNYFPKSYDDLKEVLREKSKREDVDLNDIDVSRLDEVGGFGNFRFFRFANFFVDEWDVSNAREFQWCFEHCYNFNSDVSSWDVSNAIKVYGFFNKCRVFNQSVTNFDISNAQYVYSFFVWCFNFNQEVYNFKFNFKVSDLNDFFNECISFSQDVSMWDVSNIHFFVQTFFKCENFKQDLSRWNVSNAKVWNNVFKGSLMEKYPELISEKFRGGLYLIMFKNF